MQPQRKSAPGPMVAVRVAGRGGVWYAKIININNQLNENNVRVIIHS
jgi:hypothetical protein